MYLKMKSVMDELNEIFAEREELIECMAIAILTKLDLFILGEPGQAKSDLINNFRQRITGARQYKRMLTKQTDEQMLFGRLSLKELMNDKQKLITDGKIPESEFVFLDEIFKAGEGIINSLLDVLNEREFTNEGELIKIPTHTFLSASNEIPDFNDKANDILRAVYDRFDLKVVTKNIQSRTERLRILSAKQSSIKSGIKHQFTMDELNQMQKEVQKIHIPDKLNEVMDDILCEARSKGIFISDRKFLQYSPIVKAKAWLEGRTEVKLEDFLSLKNYLWFLPNEINTIETILSKHCINPLNNQLEELVLAAYESAKGFDEVFKKDASLAENAKPHNKFKDEMLKVYRQVIGLKKEKCEDNTLVDNTVAKLEELTKNISEKAGFTYVPLQELATLNFRR